MLMTNITGLRDVFGDLYKLFIGIITIPFCVNLLYVDKTNQLYVYMYPLLLGPPFTPTTHPASPILPPLGHYQEPS